MKTFPQKTNENICRRRKRQILKEESDVTNYTTAIKLNIIAIFFHLSPSTFRETFN
jgi:hypothetical protein